MYKFSLLFFLSLICFSSLFAQVQTGKASFYSNKFEGRLTANGERFSQEAFTAAHRHLPFNTKVQVTNLANDTSIIVRINDRGPFVSNRIIDLSRSAAEKLDFIDTGVTDVVLEVVDINDDTAIVEPEKKQEKIALKKKKSIKNIVEKTDTIKVENDPKEFYELSIDRIQPDWFGIQIGSFQEVANLMRLADNLKVSFQKEITIQVKTVQEVKVYSLIIGKFNDREDAEEFNKKSVSKKYPDSFIIDFSALRNSK
ncbi:septal ring lytic transglycosylase RlpA family protein [Mesonia aquimarina]|uniref:septal ring lytic transglycosylase RlpA family protein n=1 Tax=Mesonia aquimarina TaxID=1504967 RepID=UPI000EF5A5E4|nr:septal ring lytic transglycosylase RlpA family protein [Mesonia aquimarina]